ncbi:unnamed protein product [Urochloa humidicola]
MSSHPFLSALVIGSRSSSLRNNRQRIPLPPPDAMQQVWREIKKAFVYLYLQCEYRLLCTAKDSSLSESLLEEITASVTSREFGNKTCKAHVT